MNTETTTQTHSDSESTDLISRMFAVGAHFGFTKSRRHPTVAKYIFGNKQGTDIFDLEKTSKLLLDAKEVLMKAGATHASVLFVGTKEEIAPIVEKHATAIKMPYVKNRWIGGTLTNFSEIKKRIARLKELIEERTSGEQERKYTKKERVLLGRELSNLETNFGGLVSLEKPPRLMVVVDPRHDSIAVAEAEDLGIPVVGITSSDANLKQITHPVVVNDGLQSCISLVLTELTDAYKEGMAQSGAQEARDEHRSSTTA